MFIKRVLIEALLVVMSVCLTGSVVPVSDGESQDIEVRVAVEPGKMDCFYQEANDNHNLELSYQVIEISSRFNWIYTPGFGNDLTIDFFIKDPHGRELFREYRKREGTHSHRVNERGIYTICLDNVFSSTATKIVNLEVYVYSPEDEDRWQNFQANADFTFSPETHYSDAIDSIKISINKVRDDLIRVSHEQELRRAIENRDRNIAEQNYDYVNRFSMVSIAVMIFVALLQLYMIRSLFESKSYLKKVFKGY